MELKVAPKEVLRQCSIQVLTRPAEFQQDCWVRQCPWCPNALLKLEHAPWRKREDMPKCLTEAHASTSVRHLGINGIVWLSSLVQIIEQYNWQISDCPNQILLLLHLNRQFLDCDVSPNLKLNPGIEASWQNPIHPIYVCPLCPNQQIKQPAVEMVGKISSQNGPLVTSLNLKVPRFQRTSCLPSTRLLFIRDEFTSSFLLISWRRGRNCTS